jgi:predicted porin
MQKKLVALAALAASGIASAQSSVTLFGVVDLAYESVKTNAGRIAGISPSANSSNRLGFRGVEDLGGGMSASFWLEAALNPSSGIGSSGTTSNNQTTTTAPGGLTFNRRSTVSLAGSWGELRIGRDYTPTFWNYAIFDPFAANSVGVALGTFTGAGAAATFVRSSNSVGYFLPTTLGGFYGQAMYAFGNRASTETATRPASYGTTSVNTQDNGRTVGLRLGYAQGPLNTAVSYAHTTYAAGTNSSVILGVPLSATGSYKDVSLGGSYMIGPVKAMAILFRQTLDDVSAPGVTATTKGWGLGGDWGVGAGDILVSYTRAAVNAATLATEPKSTKWALGYVHNLSKRTALYAYYSHVGNSGGAAQTAASLSSGSIGAVNGPANVNGSSTGFDIGLRHAF